MPTTARLMWLASAPSFARVFASWYALPAAAQSPVARASSASASGNQAEVAWLESVAAPLGLIFSSKQLALVITFTETHILPDGLFTDLKITDQATPGTIAKSPSQRIMMASHMLAKGRTALAHDSDSKDAPGKVKGANCGQWAEFVWIYAGTNSSLGDPGGFEGTGKNSMGPTGKTSFGGGKNEYVYGGASTKEGTKAKKQADLDGMDTAESAGGPGRKDPLGAPDGGKMFAALKGLVPGDWVWIDNRLDADGHSFIFAGWETEPIEGSYIGAEGKAHPTASGTCHAYSQRSNGTTEEARVKKSGAWAKDGGGDRHTEPLGYPFSFSPQRYPVTQICKPAADAGPAHSEKDLLHYDRGAAATKNADAIKLQKLDLARYHAEMAKAGHHAVAAATGFEEGLKELCASIVKAAETEANLTNLTTLIALVQRMNPTDKVLNPDKDPKKNANKYTGRPVRGWLDLKLPDDLALVPDGLGSIKAAT